MINLASYNKDFHANQGMVWNDCDRQYLIDYYNVAGIEEISLALERSEYSVMREVYNLTKKGLLVRKNNHTPKLLSRTKDYITEHY